ncbi:hypothetical protein ACFQ7N_19365 [Streptomyces niveus]|uniref:hypothetical protein n=1 Tax=Streptomyces niveus TaxID=193462 RepID=UPI0036B7BD96
MNNLAAPCCVSPPARTNRSSPSALLEQQLEDRGYSKYRKRVVDMQKACKMIDLAESFSPIDMAPALAEQTPTERSSSDPQFANAMWHATGPRHRRLPAHPDRVLPKGSSSA